VALRQLAQELAMFSLKTIIAAAVLTATSAAGATTVLNDDFTGEASGLALTSLTNFTVTGTVDVVGSSNPFGITTSKNVVDLDGTPGPGSLHSASFGFAANKRVTLTFVVGGAQRGSLGDNINAGFTFSAPTVIDHYTAGGGFGYGDLGSFTTSDIASAGTIAGNSPFTTYTLSFVSVGGGNVTANIGTLSADNVGPLLSSVKLDIGTVPEPASWAMMIAGFGIVGAAARRHRGFAAA